MTRHHTRRCWDWDESSVGPSPSWKWSRGEKSPRESCCTSRWRWWRGGEEADNLHRHTWTHYEYWAHWRLLSWWLYFKLMWTQQAEFQIIENSLQDDMIRVTDTFISVCSITDRFWSIRVCTMTEWMLYYLYVERLKLMFSVCRWPRSVFSGVYLKKPCLQYYFVDLALV